MVRLRLEAMLYWMHDAHAKFAKATLTHIHNEGVREPTVRRWRRHLSSLDAIGAVETHTLIEVWTALSSVNVSDPYETALADLDDSDPECLSALEGLVNVYICQSHWARMHAAAIRLMRVQEARGDEVGQRAVLLHLFHCARTSEERNDVRRRLSLLLDSSAARRECDLAFYCHRHVASELRCRGEQLWVSGRQEDAREAYWQALAIQAYNLDDFDKMINVELLEGVAETPEGKAKAYERRVEALAERFGPNDLMLADNLVNMGASVFHSGRSNDPKDVFQRVFAITKAKNGSDGLQVYRTLAWLAACADKEGRTEEAESLRRRSRAISEG